MLNMKLARIKKGMTQQELAEKIGVSSNITVSRYESGKLDPPAKRLNKIADVLGVTTDYLLGRDNN